MIPNQNRIKQQSNPTLQEHYAISQPTTTAFISTQVMERNEEKTSLQQTCKNVYVKSRLAKNTQTKGQA
mgnify:FL=1